MKAVWLAVLVAMVASSGFAARGGGKNAGLNGSAEGGFVVGGNPRDSQWLVDQLEWNQRFDASDRVRFVFNNSLAFMGKSTLTGFNNSSNYFSPLQVTGGGGSFVLANAAAYLEARLSDSLTLSVGHFSTGFGMEAALSRFDSPVYFYSGAYRQSNTNNWMYGLGLQAEVKRVIPGTFLLSFVDGRATTAQAAGALAAHYEVSIDHGSFSFLPGVSAYLGRLAGGSVLDTGLGVGAQLLMGGFGLTAEWLYAKKDTTSEVTSIYVEPTLDLGVVDVGAKAEMQSVGALRDIHIGASLTKNFADRLRLRVLFQLAGLQGNIRSGETDLRLFLGTHW